MPSTAIASTTPTLPNDHPLSICLCASVLGKPGKQRNSNSLPILAPLQTIHASRVADQLRFQAQAMDVLRGRLKPVAQRFLKAHVGSLRDQLGCIHNLLGRRRRIKFSFHLDLVSLRHEILALFHFTELASCSLMLFQLFSARIIRG